MKYLYTAVTIALFVAPTTTSAFESTYQDVFRINDTTSLFVIEYSFAFSDIAEMPVLTKRNLENTKSDTLLGYEILDDDGNQTDAGETLGIVVADADTTVTNSQTYSTTPGRTEFTLYMLFTTPDTEPEMDYSLQVTNLPFYNSSSDRTFHLTDAELSHYQTPEVEHNDSDQ